MKILVYLCLLLTLQLAAPVTASRVTGVLDVHLPSELHLQFSCLENCSFHFASLDTDLHTTKLFELTTPGTYRYAIGSGSHLYRYQNLTLDRFEAVDSVPPPNRDRIHLLTILSLLIIGMIAYEIGRQKAGENNIPSL